MPYSIEHDQFTTEEEAVTLAEAAGLFPYVVDIDEVHNDFHWHDFSAVTYVVSGAITITPRDAGVPCTLTAGSMISANAPRLVHKEDSSGYRAVIGLGQDPKTIERPIDRDPALLDA